MKFPMGKYLCMFICMLSVPAISFQSVSSSSTCKRDSKTFLHDLKSQCPLSVPCSSFPVQVDGELFENAMSSSQNDEYTAVLFYVSWCPFSSIFLSKFSALSSMYPQIKHIMVEQTSVLPSVFSRYGIHSVPSLLMVNQRSRMRYHGQKDLHSLVNFYKRTTGMDHVVDMVEEAPCNLGSNQKASKLGNGGGASSSFKKILLREEAYLVFSMLFVLGRAFLYFLPQIASHVMVYIPHLNMGILRESRQLISRVLHLVDVKRIWSKLKVCKTRNFHEGARNARVWASSLASVSLGETRERLVN